jgi:monothiol glutaredoxin
MYAPGSPSPAADATAGGSIRRKGSNVGLDSETRDRIQSLVDANEVLLFMKGKPDSPQCGFSATVVGILDQLLPSYGSFDVLSDPQVREGVKEFSSWPTIPQLYVKGELVGGCDIVQETFANGELHQQLGVDLGEKAAPEITVTEAAAAALREATGDAPEGHALHLGVDARYRSRLFLAPANEGDVAVESAGVGLRLDRLSAGRAARAVIDVVQTKRGAAFQVQLPDAPDEVPPS